MDSCKTEFCSKSRKKSMLPTINIFAQHSQCRLDRSLFNSDPKFHSTLIKILSYKTLIGKTTQRIERMLNICFSFEPSMISKRWDFSVSMMKCQRILSHNNSSDGNKVNHILQYLEEEKRKTQCKKYNHSDKFSRDESNIYK